jgi:hypothetical protein
VCSVCFVCKCNPYFEHTDLGSKNKKISHKTGDTLHTLQNYVSIWQVSNLRKVNKVIR